MHNTPQQAVAAGGGGSSAAGDFPKFTAMRDGRGRPPRPTCWSSSPEPAARPPSSAGPICWCANTWRSSARGSLCPASPRAHSRILTHSGRNIIEVERFDRVGQHGRRVSVRTRCPSARLHRRPLDTDVDRTCASGSTYRLRSARRGQRCSRSNTSWWFGRLIANTDMHLGNLAFHVGTRLRLAPVIRHAAHGLRATRRWGSATTRDFTPSLAAANLSASIWLTACYRRHGILEKRRQLTAASASRFATPVAPTRRN